MSFQTVCNICERHGECDSEKIMEQLHPASLLIGCSDCKPNQRGEEQMSERQEHKKRYNLRLQYIAEFGKWLDREPPIWKIFAWRRWKAERPLWEEIK